MTDADRTQRYWFKTPKSKPVHDQLVKYGQYLRQQSAPMNYRDRVMEMVYEEDRITQASGVNWKDILRAVGHTGAALNVTQRIIDTLAARVGKRRPAIKVKATDADYSLKRKARDLSRFIIGEQEDMKTNILSPEVLVDALVTGTGCAKIYSEGEDIRMERIPKRELFVDLREARYGNPRQLFQVKLVAREVLCDMYPKSKSQIMDAQRVEADEWTDYDELGGGTDMIEVWEGIHLPSGPDANDGRRGVCIAGHDLAYEEWTRVRFPVAFMFFAKPRKGFWGKSLAQRLLPMQKVLNDGLREMQEDMHIAGRLKIFQREGSPTPKSYLGKPRGVAIIPVAQLGGDIQYVTPQVIGQERLNWAMWWIDQMHDTGGISPQATAARNPLGGDASGVARQEFWDWESERHAVLEGNFSNWHVEVAEICIDEAKALHAAGKLVKARWGDRDVLHQIDWASVDMKEDQYSLTLEPSNFLPETRAGKIQATEQLAKLGAIPPNQTNSLLRGYPDLDRANRYGTSKQRQIEWLIEQIEDEDVAMEMLAPDAFLELDQAISDVTDAYRDAITDGATEQAPQVLERFRTWLKTAIRVKQERDKIQVTGPGMTPPPGSMPPGMPPAPAPTSMGPEGMGLPGMAPPGTGNEIPMPVM